MNLITLLGNEAQDEIEEKTKKRKGIYKYNWQTAFRIVREQFASIFNLGSLESSIDKILSEIKGSLTMIKSDRSYERHRNKRKHRFVQCYK